MMWKSINLKLLFKKGRLAGFFLFSLLLGCQPAATDPEQQLITAAKTDVIAAKQLARQRLASNELDAALHWWRHAATLGSVDALEHALRLQLRLEGRLATAHWLDKTKHSVPEQISEPLLAELGYWSESTVSQDRGWQGGAGCALVLQPVISQAQGERTWQSLQQAWQQDPQLAQLPVCFKPVIRFNSTELNCSEQAGQRIDCDYQILTSEVLTGEFQQLLVIAGRGLASYNNGIVQLPDDASLALLRHEFMHIAGFLDEYLLSPANAKAVCRVGRIAPNLLIGNDDSTLERYLQRYALTAAEVQLTPVDTCNAVGLQAYRPIAMVNPMRHFEAELPLLYAQLLHNALQQPERLMPVQYYFAYLARQEQAWQNWQRLMQGAAAFGYPAAISALAVAAEG
ncbi:hypothetical protein [Alishewanella longhuensis]